MRYVVSCEDCELKHPIRADCDKCTKHWMSRNMYSEAMTDKQALGEIRDYLLGEDWYVVDPLGHDQINVCMVDDIKDNYKPKKWARNKGKSKWK